MTLDPQWDHPATTKDTKACAARPGESVVAQGMPGGSPDNHTTPASFKDQASGAQSVFDPASGTWKLQGGNAS